MIRKALKKFNQIHGDFTKTDDYKKIKQEIEILQNLNGKCDYVINYMDQFLEKSNQFAIYYVVNNFFEVNICFKKNSFK